jgi:hypothetical protein
MRHKYDQQRQASEEIQPEVSRFGNLGNGRHDLKVIYKNVNSVLLLIFQGYTRRTKLATKKHPDSHSELRSLCSMPKSDPVIAVFPYLLDLEDREGENDTGPVPWGALNLDLSAVFLNDLLRNSKTQPGPLRLQRSSRGYSDWE